MTNRHEQNPTEIRFSKWKVKYLEQSQAWLKSEVGAEEVEDVQQVDLVHRDPPHLHALGEAEVEARDAPIVGQRFYST